MKNLRADIVIAVCALLVSGLATAASWWQTRVIAQQLSAQVWPYLSVGLSYGPSALELSINNDGLGPAIVQSLVMTVDGRPQRTFASALHALGARKGVRYRAAALAGISPGAVIRVGGQITLIRVGDPALSRLLAAQLPRVDLQTCFCSILHNCWVAGMKDSGEPRAVTRCDDRRRDQYQVGLAS